MFRIAILIFAATAFSAFGDQPPAQQAAQQAAAQQQQSQQEAARASAQQQARQQMYRDAEEQRVREETLRQAGSASSLCAANACSACDGFCLRPTPRSSCVCSKKK